MQIRSRKYTGPRQLTALWTSNIMLKQTRSRARSSSITLDLEGLESQTWHQFRLTLTFPTRLTYPFYDLTPYLIINPNMAAHP